MNHDDSENAIELEKLFESVCGSEFVKGLDREKSSDLENFPEELNGLE